MRTTALMWRTAETDKTGEALMDSAGKVEESHCKQGQNRWWINTINYTIKLCNLTIGGCNGAGGLHGAVDGDFPGGCEGGREEMRKIWRLRNVKEVKEVISAERRYRDTRLRRKKKLILQLKLLRWSGIVHSMPVSSNRALFMLPFAFFRVWTW